MVSLEKETKEFFSWKKEQEDKEREERMTEAEMDFQLK